MLQMFKKGCKRPNLLVHVLIHEARDVAAALKAPKGGALPSAPRHCGVAEIESSHYSNADTSIRMKHKNEAGYGV
jgi:hypothetical protein